MASKYGMVEEEVYLVVFGLVVGAIVVLGWKQLLNIQPALGPGHTTAEMTATATAR